MEFKDIVDSIHPLNDEQFSLLEGICEEIEVSKNQNIIHAEKMSPYLYFQKEGICRIYYHKIEREIILGFTFPGEVLISLNSYIHGKPGYESIQTLEKSKLYRISTEKLQELYKSHTSISNWGRRLAEKEALKIEERLMLRLFKSSSESYEELLKKAPNITNRIKLGYIASYLGISQVTLSRIRGIKK